MVDSPDVLGGGGRGAGVRRLNRRPLIVVGAILCLILLAVSYTYQLRLAEQRRRSAAQIPPEPVETPAILKDAPDGFIAPRRADRPESTTRAHPGRETGIGPRAATRPLRGGMGALAAGARTASPRP
jgi:type IV secretion system protein VirB10